MGFEASEELAEPVPREEGVDEPVQDVEPQDQLDFDTGKMAGLVADFDAVLTRFATSFASHGTMLEGVNGELLNLPLALDRLMAVDQAQIEAWGQARDVRMLIGVINADPETYDRPHLQDQAQTVLLNGGAKSLDALVLSLSLSHSERILAGLCQRVVDGGELTAPEERQKVQAGALAGLMLLRHGQGPFAELAGRMIPAAEGIPDSGAVTELGRKRAAKAAVIRLNSMLAASERDLEALRANCAAWRELSEHLLESGEGPAIRARYITKLVAGASELLGTFDTLLGAAASGTGTLGFLSGATTLAETLNETVLSEAIQRLADFRLKLQIERAQMIIPEAETASACTDKTKFKGLPVHAYGKDVLAFLGQVKAHASASLAALKQEIECLDAEIAAAESESNRRLREAEKAQVTEIRERLKFLGQQVVASIALFDRTVRADEAMSQSRLKTLTEFVERFGSLNEILASDLGTEGKQWAVPALRDQIVGELTGFVAPGGDYVRLGGIRLLSAVLEAAAKMLSGIDFSALRPGAAPIQQVPALREALRESLEKARRSGVIRPAELATAEGIVSQIDQWGQKAVV